VDDVRAIENLETAVFLPEKLWKKLKKKGATYLVFKVYTRDALFVETAEEIQRRPTSNVISITIPGLLGKSFLITRYIFNYFSRINILFLTINNFTSLTITFLLQITISPRSCRFSCAMERRIKLNMKVDVAIGTIRLGLVMEFPPTAVTTRIR